MDEIIIPAYVVDEAWQEVASYSPSRGAREMEALGKTQMALLAFVTASFEGLSPEAEELGLYTFFVVFKMFSKHSPHRIKMISPKSIERCHDRNLALIGNLAASHERFLIKAAEQNMAAQPHVSQYVVETLLEPLDEEDPVELTEDEIGRLFLVLKTVIDVLDEAIKKGLKRP